MEREEIYQILNDAKLALMVPKSKEEYEQDMRLRAPKVDKATIKSIVPDGAKIQYEKIAKRIFGENNEGEIIYPSDANFVINQIRQSNKKSTLRLYARAIRHVAMQELLRLLKLADKQQRQGDWLSVEEIVSSPEFSALTKLSNLFPADYAENWQPAKKRKSKKTSLLRLPKDWREQVAGLSSGQYRLPALVSLISGARPKEIENGILLTLKPDGLYLRVTKGAKVKENAGQPFREFRLADHPITDELIQVMEFTNQNEMMVKVDKGNSVTTHLRQIGKKLWPRRKESITCYTARHGMAADCKLAISEGADPDLVSQVLGHIVDKTGSYYGHRFQAGGLSVVPSNINVPKKIRHKTSARLSKRKLPSSIGNQSYLM